MPGPVRTNVPRASDLPAGIEVPSDVDHDRRVVSRHRPLAWFSARRVVGSTSFSSRREGVLMDQREFCRLLYTQAVEVVVKRGDQGSGGPTRQGSPAPACRTVAVVSGPLQEPTPTPWRRHRESNCSIRHSMQPRLASVTSSSTPTLSTRLRFSSYDSPGIIPFPMATSGWPGKR